jgi:hypothetical protein
LRGASSWEADLYSRDTERPAFGARSNTMLGRPHADTLAGSRHANMKELRFSADDGVWRVALAFDPVRHGVILGPATIRV